MRAGRVAARRRAAGRRPPAVGTARAVIDLSDNTSRFGAPPAALRVLGGAAPADAAAYPSPDADALRAALARAHGLDPDGIVVGCGSDDVIDCAIRAFGREGGRLAFAAPTFSMIPEFARNAHMEAAPAPFLEDGAWDVDALCAARPQVLYLCTPNNPTGHSPHGDLDPLLECGADLVILDEAYAEFAGRMRIAPPRHPRLLVTRTLSKAYGLAGLRVGYGAGDPAAIERVARVRGPYRIGRLAERAAEAVLREDRAWVAAHVAQARAARAALAAALGTAGFRPLPGDANFVLVPLADAAAVARRMLRLGVRVRPFTGLPGIGDALRITVGPRDEMDAALGALVAAAPEGAPRRRPGRSRP